MAKSQYTHDVVATQGEYTDRQTGEKKKRYLTLGKAFTDDQGWISAKLDSTPVGPEWSGWISLYPAKERAASPPRASPGMPPAPAATPNHLFPCQPWRRIEGFIIVHHLSAVVPAG